MPLTEDQALARLSRLVAADTEPALTGDDLSSLLQDAAVATLWTAETVYSVGDQVLSTGRNGRLYRCVEPGTSDTTEPEWGTRCAHYLGRELADGDDLVWRDMGPVVGELWDLRAAANAGWLLKAARLSDECDVTVGPQKFTLSQRITNCERMAARYAPLVVC